MGFGGGISGQVRSGRYPVDQFNITPNIMENQITENGIRFRQKIRLCKALGKVKEIASGKVKDLQGSKPKDGVEDSEVRTWSEILVTARHVADSARANDTIPPDAWAWSDELQDVIRCMEAGLKGDHTESLRAIVNKLDEVYQDAAQAAVVA